MAGLGFFLAFLMVGGVLAGLAIYSIMVLISIVGDAMGKGEDLVEQELSNED